MSTLICALLAVTMPPQTTSEAADYNGTPVVETAKSEVVVPDWTVRQWRINVTAALRKQALAEGADKHQASRELITLLQQLRQADLRRSEARVMGKSLVNRLVRTHHEIVKEILEKEFLAAKAKEAEAAKQGDKPAAVAIDAQDDVALDDVAQGDGEQLADDVILAQAGAILAQPGGGPIVGGNGGARANLGEDEGQQLAELIEATIDPESWDTVGGPGSIIYWNQFKVLVIRATAETHEKIGGLNGALRKVGN